jgi:hypothetical protein
MQSFFLQTANDVIIISLDATDRVISWQGLKKILGRPKPRAF